MRHRFKKDLNLYKIGEAYKSKTHKVTVNYVSGLSRIILKLVRGKWVLVK